MGKSRSHEVMEYRTIIMNKICQNEKLIKLLAEDRELEETDPEEWDSILPYNHVYPHEFVPDTNMVNGKFLNFEIQCTIDPRNPTFKTMQLYFFCVCHQNVIDVVEDGYHRCWFDLVACEVDNMFGEQNVLGVGTTTIVSNEPYYVSYAANIPYKGRTLIFNVKDFTDGKKNGR